MHNTSDDHSSHLGVATVTYRGVNSNTSSGKGIVTRTPTERKTRVVLESATDSERTAKQGRVSWDILHRYGGCDPAFFEAWTYTIPKYGCSCSRDFKSILEELPPDFSSDDAFFIRGVEWHNAVNRKLGKPEITIEEARSIWQKE
jgi:hypothetical protein